jgi:hypothetical protein
MENIIAAKEDKAARHGWRITESEELQQACEILANARPAREKPRHLAALHRESYSCLANNMPYRTLWPAEPDAMVPETDWALAQLDYPYYDLDTEGMEAFPKNERFYVRLQQIWASRPAKDKLKKILEGGFITLPIEDGAAPHSLTLVEYNRKEADKKLRRMTLSQDCLRRGRGPTTTLRTTELCAKDGNPYRVGGDTVRLVTTWYRHQVVKPYLLAGCIRDMQRIARRGLKLNGNPHYEDCPVLSLNESSIDIPDVGHVFWERGESPAQQNALSRDVLQYYMKQADWHTEFTSLARIIKWHRKQPPQVPPIRWRVKGLQACLPVWRRRHEGPETTLPVPDCTKGLDLLEQVLQYMLSLTKKEEKA